MAKRRKKVTKVAAKKAAKKPAHKPSKGRAKKAAAGHKPRKPAKANMGFFDQLLAMFAGPDTRKT
jgi:hypothetical protein